MIYFVVYYILTIMRSYYLDKAIQGIKRDNIMEENLFDNKDIEPMKSQTVIERIKELERCIDKLNENYYISLINNRALLIKIMNLNKFLGIE